MKESLNSDTDRAQPKPKPSRDNTAQEMLAFLDDVTACLCCRSTMIQRQYKTVSFVRRNNMIRHAARSGAYGLTLFIADGIR